MTIVETHTIPEIEDPLAEALHFLRMDGMFYCRSELTAPWGVTMPQMPHGLWFHVVTAGSCELVDSSGEVHRVNEGEVIVLPHGAGHQARDSEDAATPIVFDVPHEYISRQYAIMRHGGGGEACNILCGVVRIGSPAARVLVQHLPEFIRVDASTSGVDWHWFPSLMALMANETRATRPGGETVVTRLCDILIIQAIRAWIENDPDAQQGWIAALRDPLIGQAIAMIHREPERDWTVASLASEVAMSRSGFSARFSELVGQSPKRYLTMWRMELARSLLEDETVTVMDAATQLGYQSEAAFSRAFKRVTGMSPSESRQRRDHEFADHAP